MGNLSVPDIVVILDSVVVAKLPEIINELMVTDAIAKPFFHLLDDGNGIIFLSEEQN